MENNTLISHELEEMRSQISLLKEKLDKQTIVNEQHIRKSAKAKLSDINRTITGTIIAGIFALIYCTWYFNSQGLSLAFVISTAVMLAVCLTLTIVQKCTIGRLDFSQESIVDAAKKLSKVKSHYQGWYKIAIPMIIIWLAWLVYEMIRTMGISPLTIGFFCGAGIGAIIGGFIGHKINRKVINKASEILDQIEELQKGE